MLHNASGKKRKKINCTRANISYFLKIKQASKAAFLFTHLCWRKHHAGCKTYEEHLEVTGTDLSIPEECCCVSQGYWGAPNTDLLVHFPGLWQLPRTECKWLLPLQNVSVTSKLCLRSAELTATRSLVFHMHPDQELLFLTLPTVKGIVEDSTLT